MSRRRYSTVFPDPVSRALVVASGPIVPPVDWDNDRYCTPPEALAPVYAFFAPLGIGLDPCGDPDSIVKCETQFDIRNGEDGLALGWWDRIVTVCPETPTAFYNPRYSDIGPWVGKAAGETEDSPLVTVGLYPPSTDTIWWDDHVWKSAAAICWVRGRYRFLMQGRPDTRGPRGMSAFVLHAGLSCRVQAQQDFAVEFASTGQVIVNVNGKWGTSVSKPRGFHV